MDALTPPPSHPRPVPAPAVQETAGRRAAAHRAAGRRAAGRRGHLRLVTTGAVRGGAGAASPGTDGRRAVMPELTRRPSAPRRPNRTCGAARTASHRTAARPVPLPSRTDPALGGADADLGRAPSRSDLARLAPMHPAVRAQHRRREAARTPGRATPACATAVVRAAAPAHPAAPALPAVAVVLRRAAAAGLAALAPVLLALVGIALIG